MKNAKMLYLLLFLILSLHVVRSELPGLNESVSDRQMSEKNRKFAIGVDEALGVVKAHKLKVPTDWLYNSECRVTVSKSNDQCVTNDFSRMCFTERIDYNYTLKSDVQLPSYAGVLQRFPQCWSYLGPLLCATFFRPCALRRFVDNRANDRILKHVEARQIFSTRFCSETRIACSFIVELGLWPNFLDCNDEVDNKYLNVQVAANDSDNATKSLFRSDCKAKYVGAPSRAPTFQCLWPLVNNSGEVNGEALIDKCYMPCKSPLIDNQESLALFQGVTFGFSLALLIVFGLIAIYLRFFSQMFLDSFETFLVTQSLLCISVFYALWMLLSTDVFPWIADEAVCAASGRLRNTSPKIILNNLSLLKNLLSICSLEAFAFLFTLICAYSWLSSFVLHRYCAQRFDSADYPIFVNSTSKPSVGNAVISARKIATFAIYSISAIFVLLLLLFYEIPIDGISRVCNFSGRINGFRHSFVGYAPILTMKGVIVIFLLFYNMRNKACANKRSLQKLEDGVQKPVDSNVLGQPLIPSVNNSTLVNKFSTQLDAENNMVEIVQNEYFLGTGKAVFCNSQFLFIFFSNLTFCGFALATYLSFDMKSEKENVLRYINCSIKSTASNFNSNWAHSDSWLSDMRTQNFDPYVRKIDLKSYFAPNCILENIARSQLWFSTAFLLLYPALPFIAISLCLLFSLVYDKRRMIGLRKIRKNIFSLPKSIESKFSSLGSLNNLSSSIRGSNQSKLPEETNCLIGNRDTKHNFSDNACRPMSASSNNSISSSLNSAIPNTTNLPIYPTFLPASTVPSPAHSVPITPTPILLQPQLCNYNSYLNGVYMPSIPFGNNFNFNPYTSNLMSASTKNLLSGSYPSAYNGYNVDPPTANVDTKPNVPAASLANSDPTEMQSSKLRRINLDDNFKKHKLARIIAQKSGQLMANQYEQQRYQQQLEQRLKELYGIQNQQESSFTTMIEKMNLSDTASLRSLNSSATFNMTSVSQQPNTVPGIDPDVINVVFACGYKQGAMQEQQKMEQRIGELTKTIAAATFVIQQLSTEKQREDGVVDSATNSDQRSSQNVSSAEHSTNDFESARIPMIFGAEGQKLMSEFKLKHGVDDVESIACNLYTQAQCDCKNKCNDENDSGDNNDDEEEGDDEDDLSTEYSKTINGVDINDESLSDNESNEIRLSDEFNSDSEDLEEENFYRIQLEMFKTKKLTTSPDAVLENLDDLRIPCHQQQQQHLEEVE